MIRRAGVLCFIGFLLCTLLLYRREERRRLSELQGLLRLLTHLCDTLAVAPLPLSEIYAAFRDDALMRCGFLRVLRNEGLAAALEAGVLRLPDEELFSLREYAVSLGSRPYVEEKKKTEEIRRRLITLLAEREKTSLTRTKLVGTLFFSGGMLLLLLLL